MTSRQIITAVAAGIVLAASILSGVAMPGLVPLDPPTTAPAGQLA